MLTRGVVLATVLTVGLVAGVGSSALAVAFIPGNASGESQNAQAIAASSQDPAEGSSASLVAGAPVIVTVAEPIAVDGWDDSSSGSDADSPEIVPATEPAPAAPGSEGSDSNSGSSNSGQSVEDKAKDDKAKKDKEKKEKEEKEKKDKKDKKDKNVEPEDVPADQ
jgi:hypothetical protein